MSAKQKCHFKWKRAHRTLADAEAHLRHLRGRYRNAAAPQRVYQCGDHWHVGNARVKRGRR